MFDTVFNFTLIIKFMECFDPLCLHAFEITKGI